MDVSLNSMPSKIGKKGEGRRRACNVGSALLWFGTQLHRQSQENRQGVGTGAQAIGVRKVGWKHLALPV